MYNFQLLQHHPNRNGLAIMSLGSTTVLYTHTLGYSHNKHGNEAPLAAFSDVRELLAIPSHAPENGGGVSVYRLNGQLIHTVGHPEGDDEAEVEAVAWKPDGSLLGVCWRGGKCCLFSGEDGRVVGVVSMGRGGERAEVGAGLGCSMGWTTYAPPPTSRANGEGVHDGMVDEWFDDSEGLVAGDFDGDRVRGKIGLSSLTRSITALDVTKVLPTLSAIPAHGLRLGADGSKFGTQAAVDAAFEVRDAVLDNISILHVTAGAGGYCNMLLDESVRVGTVEFGAGACLRQASHPLCASQVVISERREASGKVVKGEEQSSSVVLSYVDLPLETLSSPLLHVIATNTKNLQNLMVYVTQTIRCVQHDFETGLSLPKKLIERLKEELETQEADDPVHTLLHTASTSTFNPVMLEWLIDVVKEANLKRWEQAVGTMYSNIRNHITINLQPALDRLSIATSALRGQAGLHEGSKRFNVPQKPFSDLLDHIDCVRQVAERMLAVVNTESKQFRHFSQWLRLMIEVGATGPGSKSACEAEEREQPNLNHGLIQQYITQTMSRSKVAVHIEQRPEMQEMSSGGESFNRLFIKDLNYEMVLMALRRMDDQSYHKGADNHMSLMRLEIVKDPESLVNLPTLTVVLAARVQVCVEAISKWQGRMLGPPISQPLDMSGRICDFKMFPDKPEKPDLGSVAILLTKDGNGANDGGLEMLCVTRSGENDFKVQERRERYKIVNGMIRQANLRGDSSLDCIVLCRDDGQSDSNSDVDIIATTRRWHLLECSLAAYDKEDPQKWMKRLHAFDPNEVFEPSGFRLGGRPGKEVCVVFGDSEDGQNSSWKVLDISAVGSVTNGGTHLDEDEEMQF